jgi:hypothetical protein
VGSEPQYVYVYRMSFERIVSFLPSSTEILYELGAGDQIVGVTRECNYPSDAKTKPTVVNAIFVCLSVLAFLFERLQCLYSILKVNQAIQQISKNCL